MENVEYGFMKRDLVRRYTSRIAGMDKLAGLHRRLTREERIVLLMYHEVMEDDLEIDAWTVVREREFRAQMQYLKDNYLILPLVDALELMCSDGTRMPDNVAVVTFDDGYCGNVRVVLPVISELGIPVTVFVCTEASASRRHYWYDRVIINMQLYGENLYDVDLRDHGLRRHVLDPRCVGDARWRVIQGVLTDLKQLDPRKREEVVDKRFRIKENAELSSRRLLPASIDEVQLLAANSLVTIGSHSHRHDLLIQLDNKTMYADLALSKSLLEEWTGRAIVCLAYPSGLYNDDIIGAVQQMGFKCALTTGDKSWCKGIQRFAIPRIGIGRYDSLQHFKRKLACL